MNKLIILLKQLNIIDQVSILMHANLKKVVVHQDNEYSFYIESKDFIPFEEYQFFLEFPLRPYLPLILIQRLHLHCHLLHRLHLHCRLRHRRNHREQYKLYSHPLR